VSNLEKFIAALTAAYTSLYESDPQTYQMAKSRYTPAELAEKMAMGLKKRDANKDGEGVKRACKACGIKYTYTAIQAYLA
jgi:hypothetical protein